MTDKERNRLREITNAFLSHPTIRHEISVKGWDANIAWTGDSPTYAEIRDVIFPKWVPWFSEFLTDNPT